MNWIVLTAFSDTLCPNNSNFHFRQRRFFPSYTSRSHSYRHTDVSHVHTIPVDIIIIHNCTFGLFVYFSRLCCDSVTFLSSLFTNRPTKKQQKQKWKLQMKWKRETHTLCFYLSQQQRQQLCNFSMFFLKYIYLSFVSSSTIFRLFFFLLFTRAKKKEIHEKSSIIHLKCLKIP